MQSAKRNAWDDSLQLPVVRASREIQNIKFKILELRCNYK